MGKKLLILILVLVLFFGYNIPRCFIKPTPNIYAQEIIKGRTIFAQENGTSGIVPYQVNVDHTDNGDGTINITLSAGSQSPWTQDINGSSYNLTTTGNITSGYFLGNGSQLTGLPTYTNESTTVSNTSTINLTKSTYDISAAINSTLVTSWNNKGTSNYTADQAVNTTSAVTFATVDTGQGANELYNMNQNVRTTDEPTFANITVTGLSGMVKATTGKLVAASADTDYLVTLNKDLVTTAPLAGGTDNILPGADADITLSIADAVADGSTKGASAYTANDFNAASGVVSLDYANGQAANATQHGFLSETDWLTFNGKGSAAYEFAANNFNGTGNFNTTGNFTVGNITVSGTVDGKDVSTLGTGDMSYANTRFKVGQFTRDMTAASGTQAVTGIGFAPKAVIVFAVHGSLDSYSWGLCDSTPSAVATLRYGGNPSDGTYIIAIGDATFGNRQTATMSSLDADGFTVNWTKTGSPTETAYMDYMAIR